MKCDSTKILAVIFALLPSTGMAAEQTMGRLFFTSEQRAKMDVARQQERSIRFDLEQQEDAPPPANVTLNGVITRSDGKTTLWVNNRIQNEVSPATTVGKRGEIRVTPEAGRAVPLKVGQSVDMSSGRVDEAYRRSSPGEAPPASSRGAEKSPLPPRRQDDAPETSADVQGEASPSR